MDTLNRRIVSYYSIFIGIAVILMWSIIILKQEIAEGKTEMFYHLFSEFLMAVLCVVSGILLLLNKRKRKHLPDFKLILSPETDNQDS